MGLYFVWFLWFKLVLVIATSTVCETLGYGVSFSYLANLHTSYNLFVKHQIMIFCCLLSQDNAHNVYAKHHDMMFLLNNLVSKDSADN